MASIKERMQYLIELGFDGSEAERDSKKTFDKIEDHAEDATGGFKGIGGKMGSALVAGFAAIGAGALIIDSLNKSAERAARRDILQGQFDLTEQEAARFGELAGELYADGFGEGIDDLQQIAARSIREFGEMTDAELEGITASVAAVSKTFGEDFQGVIRSTSQLLENDLAGSAQEALDIIVGAFQEGGNEAGDLLDTIDEYSQHWAAMGLSAEDALNQVVHGLQNGQRDADKMADAVKEMRLRVTENADGVREALEDIGLDADEVVNAFLEGGPAAREAFLEVVDALKRGQDQGDDTSNAVAIIGTQFEDLGPQALDSLAAVDGGLERTTGKAEKLAETVKATPWENLAREGETFLGRIGDKIAGELAPAVGGLNDLVDGSAFSWESWSDKGVEGSSELANALNTGVADAAGLVVDGLKELAAESERGDAKAKAHAAALGTLDSELEAIRSNAPDAADDLADLGEEAGDATDNVEELTEAFAGLLDEIDDRSAYRNVQDGFDQVHRSAEAAFEAAETGGREAAAAARDHEQAIDDLRREVIEYAQELGNVPPKTVSEIQALIDEGAFTEAERRLAQLARHRDAIITARTIVRNAPSSAFSQQPISQPSTTSSGGSNPNAEFTGFDTGGVVGGPKGAAQLALVHGGETILPTHKKPLPEGIGGNSYHITVNAGIGTNGPEVGRIIADEIRKFERRNGPGWRQ